MEWGSVRFMSTFSPFFQEDLCSTFSPFFKGQSVLLLFGGEKGDGRGAANKKIPHAAT